MLNEANAARGVDIGDIDGVLLTHLHADHCSGLEGFGYFARFVLQKKARLWAHPSVLGRLWEGHLAAGMEALLAPGAERPHDMRLDDYFEIEPLSFETRVQIGPFSVLARPTIHHVPTTALRIATAERELAYSADTSFDPDLIAWLAQADLVVHETNYGVHTPYERLAELPRDLRGKMLLIHYPDDFDTKASVIQPLEQGRRYQI
jgi:ribonuclease BN (tRNA processing enzyme)